MIYSKFSGQIMAWEIERITSRGWTDGKLERLTTILNGARSLSDFVSLHRDINQAEASYGQETSRRT